MVPSKWSLNWTELTEHVLEDSVLAGLHILMPVCIRSVFRRWESLGWLCPDIHSHTSIRCPSTPIKEGCATLLWAYLRDYRHENTTSQPSAGGPAVIVSCQTSKVPLTASYLTFSFNKFIFHSLVFWQQGHLWPNLALFSHRVTPSQWEQSEYCTVKEENVTLMKKRSHQVTVDLAVPLRLPYIYDKVRYCCTLND